MASKGDNGEPLRVIVVDDYPPLRSLLRALLEPRSCVVVGEADNGADAIELVDRVPCDVVTMDYNMPEVNGLDATSAIHERHPDVHIVAFTSTTDAPIVEALMEAGASAHFSKLDFNPLVDHLVELRLQLRGWRP
jgi:DNA-binding NarL/FixJ family response regulator